jgi:hypothetical protein
MLRTPLDPARLARLFEEGGALRGLSPWTDEYYVPVIDWRQARVPGAPEIDWPAVWWVLAVPAALALAAGRHLLPHVRRRWWLVAAAGGAALLLWRWQLAGGGQLLCGIMVIAPAIALAWWLPLRRQRWLFAAALAGALLLCMPLFHASCGWFTIGWCFGTYQWQTMIMGATDNIPGLMVQRLPWAYGNHRALLAEVWRIPAASLGLGPGDIAIDLKTLLAGIYGLALLACCVGAARHLRRGDRRLLVAVVAPWVLFFVILGQMHERYLLWAAALSAALVAVDLGYLLLHLFLTAASWIQIIHIMVWNSSGYWRTLWSHPQPGAIAPRWCYRLYLWAVATHPDLAWGLAAAAALLLYQAIASRRPVPDAAAGRPAAGQQQPVALTRTVYA